MARRPDGAAERQTRGPGVPRLPQYGLQTHKGQRLQNHYLENSTIGLGKQQRYST